MKEREGGREGEGERERGRERRGRRHSRRREGRKEKERVEFCYYGAAPWPRRTTQYGAISDFHPPKSRIYACVSACS
jgi:hypothetical protein